MAMMVVTGIVAMAAVLSWAMISISSLQARIDKNTTDTIDLMYQAESGASLGLYYLRYPEMVPSKVRLLTGPYGDPHYPGQTDIQLWSDANALVNIEVTNIGQQRFRIDSTARPLGDGESYKVSVVAATEISYGAPSDAFSVNATFDIPSNMKIFPSVATTQPSQVGGNTASPSAIDHRVNIEPVAGTPSYRQVNLFSSTGQTSGFLNMYGTYYWNGNGPYRAERLILSGWIYELRTLNPAQNPANVWFADSSVTLVGLDNFKGTIVVRGDGTAYQPSSRTLKFIGNNTMTSYDGLPVIVAGNDLVLETVRSSSMPTTSVLINGAVWIGDDIAATGLSTTQGGLTINGALIMGGKSPQVQSSMRSPIEVRYSADNLKSLRLTAPRVVDVSIISWNDAVN